MAEAFGQGLERLVLGGLSRGGEGRQGTAVEGAVEEGLPAQRAYFFTDADEAGKFCRTILQPDDVVLVKGSRGVRLERVTESLQSSAAVK